METTTLMIFWGWVMHALGECRDTLRLSTAGRGTAGILLFGMGLMQF